MATQTQVKEKTAAISSIQKVWLNARIIGVTPLIAHRFSLTAQLQMEDAQQGKAKVKKPPRNPEREFQEAIYRCDDGSFGFPAIAVKKAMVYAGQRFADEKRTELFGAFSIPVEMLRLEADEPKMRSDRVVLMGKTSSIAYRPEFMPWAMNVEIVVNESFINHEQIINLLNLAGFGIGIGDWRVEKQGSFGQFKVAEVKVSRRREE